MSTPSDAQTYDVSSTPQRAWAQDVLPRLDGIAPDTRILDVGCGTGRVAQSLPALVPAGRVLAIDASVDMVEFALARLDDRAEMSCQDVLELELAGQVDVIASIAAPHWVTDRERLWHQSAVARRPSGVLEVQCGGAGNIARVRGHGS